MHHAHKPCATTHGKVLAISDLAYHMVVFLPPMNEKWVWQKHLGHASWILISKLNKLKLVKGLSDLRYHSNALCGSYKKGKIVKSSFKSENIVATSRTYRSIWCTKISAYAICFLHYMLFSKLEPNPWPFNHITTISRCVETYFLVKKKTLLVDKYYSTRYWQWVFVGLLIFIHDLVFDSIHPQIFKQCTLTFEWHNPKTFPMHVGCFHQLEKRI